MGEFGKVEVHGPLGIIRLDPPPLNTLNGRAQDELALASQEIDANDGVPAREPTRSTTMETQLSNDAELAKTRPAVTRRMTAGLGDGVHCLRLGSDGSSQVPERGSTRPADSLTGPRPRRRIRASIRFCWHLVWEEYAAFAVDYVSVVTPTVVRSSGLPRRRG
jgi:hypothetical protein